jgi:holliday junction resolvase YEN1
MKKLIAAFGFVSWDAPGEAEAECALLQKSGYVDLVITEDVDSLMFGATKVAREVSSGKRSHLDVYSDIMLATGLNTDGLVLIAMLSGGDYFPAGIQKCGPKIALEV